MKKLLSFLLGILFIGISGYFLYEIITWLASTFKNVNPSVGAAIIASTATIISSVFIASYNSRKGKERVAFEAHREKKAEVYNEFMSMVVELMRNTNEGKEGDDILPENIEEFFYNFTAKVTVYGGPGVVKAYAKWRSKAANDDGGVSSLLLIDNLFREMRADLGESNKGIEANELLGLYIVGGKSEIAKEANKAIKSDS